MRVFNIYKNSIEIKYKDRKGIREGGTIDQFDCDPELIKGFESQEQAKEELSKYKSGIKELSGPIGKYYLVEEYYVQEEEQGEDGEIIESFGILEFSKIKIELVEKPSYETLATFDNMKDAEIAKDNYSGDNEVYLSF